MAPPRKIIPTKVKYSPRLPPLPRLSVRRTNKEDESPCVGIMSAVLGCWASSGQGAQGCKQLEEALRKCMDQPPETRAKGKSLNFHLARFQGKFTGPTKKK